MSRSRKLISSIEAWRTKFEKDPNITYEQIGASVDRSGSTIRKHASLFGWKRSKEIHDKALMLASQRGSQKRSSMARNPLTAGTPADRRERARKEWETDPAMTYTALANKLGMKVCSISYHAKRYGWERSAAVEMQASLIRSARRRENMLKAIAGGYVVDSSAARQARAEKAEKAANPVPVENAKGRRYPCWDTRQKERAYAPPERYASVFDYAAGVTA